MAQRLLDLARQQLAVVAEVAFQGVLVDDDPVFEVLAADAVAEVLAVGVVRGAEVGDDHGDAPEDRLEFLGQGVDGVGHQRLELVRLGLIHWLKVIRHEEGKAVMREGSESRKKPRALVPLLAVLAIAAGGVVWSGCGGDDNTTNVDTEGAQREIEQGAEKAEKAIEEGVDDAEKGLNEAQEKVEGSKAEERIEEGRKKAEKGIEEGKEQAEKGIEEAKEKAEDLLP